MNYGKNYYPFFLKEINDALIKAAITDGKIYSSKRSYQSVYNNKDSIKIFRLIYKNTGINSFFMRKFRIFKDYFELRPQMVDEAIKNILAYHNNGHVVK